jgi:hypothetical protein
MRILQKMLRHNAIYWQYKGVNEYGRPEFFDPIIIRCRWDTFATSNDVADTQDNRSVGMSVLPDRVLVVGSYLMYGDETVLSGLTEKPPDIPNAYMIKNQELVPELSFTQYSTEPGYQSDRLSIKVTL